MATAKAVDFRDYIRVAFARVWWILFITLGVTGLVFFYSFYRAPRVYAAENQIIVTDKFSGSIARDIGPTADWVTRMRRAELDLKRAVPAREVTEGAAAAIGFRLSEPDIVRMVESFGDDLKVTYYKDGSFINLSYTAGNGKLAAAVLSLFIKRAIDSCVALQVGELNNEVSTLTVLKDRLASDVAASQKRLDEMKTVAPEMRLTASTMALLRNGQSLTTTPSTEQAVAVFLELQRDVITLDGQIADMGEQISQITRQIAEEPQALPSQRKLEAMPAVRDAMKKRDEAKLRLAQLLANSTAEHPLVKKLQAEVKGYDEFLRSAATTSTVEVVYEANQKRADLQKKLSELESGLAGLRERRANMEDNAAKWRDKLDGMPAEFRLVREATLDYENKAKNLSMVTDRLVQAQIKRNLELEQVGTYYRPQFDLTPVPAMYQNKHVKQLLLGLILGLVASVFAVYAMEFADHSVRDQRDFRLYTKAAVLGVISDYNQLKAVASRAGWTKAAGLKQYALAMLFVALTASLGWATWRNWPRQDLSPAAKLPEVLSAASVTTIEQAMEVYPAPADLDAYATGAAPDVELTPAVEVPAEQAPLPALSE